MPVEVGPADMGRIGSMQGETGQRGECSLCSGRLTWNFTPHRFRTMFAGSTTADASAPASKATGAWRQITKDADPFLEAVSASLRAQVGEFEPHIADYVGFALEAQGKQLRPLLVALSAGCFGRPTGEHVKIAVIIEMVHLATLVHDDIMDGAEIRRGRPTLAARWGSEISVLVGDCLFAHALRLASEFPTTQVCRAVSIATNTVCAGEILQTQKRRDFTVTRTEYFRMLAMKTGELFGLACDLGGHVGGATASQQAALRQYGMALGTAYQVYDDCVDLFSTEGVAGKSLGTDLAKGKLTLPVFVALERSSDIEAAELQKQLLGWKPEMFAGVLSLAKRHKVSGECRKVIDAFVLEADRALQSLPASPGRGGLEHLGIFLSEQTSKLIG